MVMVNGTAAEKSTPGGGVSLVADHGLAMLRIEGEDATHFLDAQCTAALAEDGEAVQIAAIADAKGRVLLVFRAWHTEDAWWLAVPAGEADWLHGHLERFVFRSRVRIAAAPERRLLGVLGPDAEAALAAVGLPTPGRNHRLRAGPLEVLGLAGNRRLLTGEQTALADAAHALAPHAAAGETATWQRARLFAGEAEIRAETRGRFLPQMLGLVELGAVSFRKGCYPGQEVIARTQHLGRVKRALALFRLDALLEAGSAGEVEDARFDVLDGVILSAGGALVQAVAPSPLPEALLPLQIISRQTRTASD